MRQHILFLSWKDITHPSAGGAELLTDTLAQHVAHSHEVLYFTSSYIGAKTTEALHGYTIIRKGNLYTVYFHAFFWWHSQKLYAKKYIRIIDQVHGIPFFSLFYYRHPAICTLIMEIAGSLWSTKYVMPVALCGKLLEQLWMFLYRTMRVVTISPSTKNELISHGFTSSNISILPMFTNMQHKEIPNKSKQPTLIFIGRIAPVKQVANAIEAFLIAKKSNPALQLIIIGKTEPAYEKYAQDIMHKTSDNPNIILVTNASEEQKQMWLSSSHLLLMPSKKEGYGLVILEAAACGTPAIGYSVPGIQDAILHEKTGILTSKNSPQELAKSICEILANKTRYNNMQQSAFKYAQSHTKERTAFAFKKFF